MHKSPMIVFMYLFCSNTAVIIDSSYFNRITHHYNLKKGSRNPSLQIGTLCTLFLSLRVLYTGLKWT